MAATKTRNAKAEDVGEGMEVSDSGEVNDAAPEKVRRTPTRPTPVFEIVAELPDNPRRGRKAGYTGPSKWVKILADFVEQAPADTWVRVMDYSNVTGARLAEKNINENDHGPEGYTFETGTRRYDVDEVGEDGETKKVRHSGLFLKYSKV